MSAGAESLFFAAAVGHWSGPSKLWLEPGVPALECDSTAEVVRVAGERFLRLSYTWSFKGEPASGELLIAADLDDAEWSAVWGDSWHQHRRFLELRGPLEDPARFAGGGEYPAGEGEPPWGWRIALELEAEQLVLRMWNVTPAGESALAVETVYTKR